MKRTKRKIDEPAPTKAPKTAGSASAGSASEPLSAAVPNPLKDKALIQAAAIAAARELVGDSCLPTLRNPFQLMRESLAEQALP